jgi:RNA polymerase sigma factor for flagellar operon FliA
VDNIDKIWQEYSVKKDIALRDKLILHYSPLVKYVAGRLSMHLNQHVEYDDLISYGIFGLIDAIDKFKYEKGVKFETYASLRIRGAIIDSIRKMDWVPRTLRKKNKELDVVYHELESELGRAPTDEELSVKLCITVEETRDLLKKSSVVSLISLDDYLDANHESNFFDKNPDNMENPETKYERTEVRQMLADAIDKLSEKEKKVVTLYYYEELTLKEISHIMGVSESRISQIHSKAVSKLSVKLGKFKSLLFLP